MFCFHSIDRYISLNHSRCLSFLSPIQNRLACGILKICEIWRVGRMVTAWQYLYPPSLFASKLFFMGSNTKPWKKNVKKIELHQRHHMSLTPNVGKRMVGRIFPVASVSGCGDQSWGQESIQTPHFEERIPKMQLVHFSKVYKEGNKTTVSPNSYYPNSSLHPSSSSRAEVWDGERFIGVFRERDWRLYLTSLFLPKVKYFGGGGGRRITSKKLTQRDKGYQGDRETSISFSGGSLKKCKNLHTHPCPEQQIVRFMEVCDMYLWNWGVGRKEDL